MPRLAELLRTVRAKVRTPWGLVLLIGSAMWVLLTIAARIWFEGQAGELLEAVLRWRQEWSRKSIGTVALVMVVLLSVIVTAGVVALLLSLWLAHRPKSDKPRKSTGEEKELIQHYRTLWNRHGALPVHEVLEQLQEAKRLLEHVYWIRGLASFVEKLDAGFKGLNAALADDSTEPLTVVEERFNQMYGAYLHALEWLVDIHVGGDRAVLDSERTKTWMPHHRAFREELENMVERPECRGKLKIHHRPLARFDKRSLILFLESVEAGNYETPVSGGVFERLKRCTAEERLLLRLFVTGAGVYSADSLLPNSVYHTVYALTRDGVLRHVRESDGMARLTIGDGVREWIQSHLVNGAPANAEVVIDLRHVEGTGASGGGATGGGRH